jgi:hypothetical protein
MVNGEWSMLSCFILSFVFALMQKEIFHKTSDGFSVLINVRMHLQLSDASVSYELARNSCA